LPEGLREYKKKEKLLYARLVAGAGAFFGAFIAVPRRFAAWAGRKTSIVVIPHTGAASRRLQASRFALGAVGLAFVAVLGFSVFATGRHLATLSMLDAARLTLDERDARLLVNGAGIAHPSLEMYAEETALRVYANGEFLGVGIAKEGKLHIRLNLAKGGEDA